MLKVEDLKNIYPLIVTPSHDGKYFHNYLLSLLNFQHVASQVGMPIQIFLSHGESLVTRARNNAVAEFLANDEWTHLFWIDSDIGFDIDSAFRLLLSDYEIAAGVYPLKRDVWPEDGLPAKMTERDYINNYQKYTVNASPKNKRKKEINLVINEHGFMEMSEAPTGFMVIKRSVFESMMKKYPELQYVSDTVDIDNKGLHYRFFDVMVHPETKRYLSEDYGFCYLWEKMGGKIYVDARSTLTHQGSKLYQGNFGAALQTNLANAVAATKGLKLNIIGLENI
jgi:hypothetical protein